MSKVSRRCAPPGALVFNYPVPLSHNTPSGVKLLYLPPYSPDFNPIETGFSAFKADGRRYGHAFRAALDHPDPIVTTSYFNLMLQRVFTPANTRAWFKKSGYF